MGYPEADYVIGELEQRLVSMTQKVNELNTAIGQVEGNLDKQLGTIRSSLTQYEVENEHTIEKLVDSEQVTPDKGSIVLGEFTPNEYDIAMFRYRIKSSYSSYYTYISITRKNDDTEVFYFSTKVTSYTDYESEDAIRLEKGVTYVVTLGNNKGIGRCDNFEIVKLNDSSFDIVKNFVTSEVSMKPTSTSFEGYAKLLATFVPEYDGSFNMLCSLNSSTSSYQMRLMVFEDYDPLKTTNGDAFLYIVHNSTTYALYYKTLRLRKGHTYSFYLYPPRYGTSTGYTAYCNLLTLLSTSVKYTGVKTIKSLHRGIVSCSENGDTVIPIYPFIDPSKTVVNIRSPYDGSASHVSVVKGLTYDSLTLSPTYTIGESVSGSTTYDYKEIAYELVEFY